VNSDSNTTALAAEPKPRGAGVGWNLASAAIPLVGSFAVSVLLAPYLGPAEFGRYMTAMSAATLALIVGKLGVHTATSRQLSEQPESARVWLKAGLALRTLATLPVAALAIAVAPALARLLEGESLVPTFHWLWIVILSASFYEFGSEALIGLRSFRALLVSRLMAMVIRLAAVFWVQASGLASAAFLLLHAISQAVPAAAILVGLTARLPASQREDADFRAAFRRTWDVALPLAVGTASYLIYSHTDRLMIAWFDDSSGVGQFAVARNVLDAVLFPLFALGWSVRPALVRAWKDIQARERVMGGSNQLSLHFALTGGALCVVVLPRLLVTLYGPDYETAGRLLAWMTPILVLRALGSPLLPGLLAADRQTSYARWMSVTAGINVLANLLLIPRFGAFGAVMGTLVALVALTLGGWAELWRAGGRLHPRPKAWLGSLAAALLLLASSPWIAPADAGLVRQFVGAGLASLLVAIPLLIPQKWD